MSATVAASVYRSGEGHLECFYVSDVSAVKVTGLVNANFTKLVYKDGVASAVIATVTEISNGDYKLTFTPNAVGHWYVHVIHATYGDWFGSWYAQLSDLGELDIVSVTAFPTSGITSGTLADISRSVEAYTGKGKRITISYNGASSMSSALIELSYDAFVTVNKSYTDTVTFGAPATPLRPTIMTWG